MPRMNETEPTIEIFKPFGEAFELMKKILFQPFDLKKWLIIGFAAFLASLSGGFSSSFNPFSRWSSQRDQKAIAESFREMPSVSQMEWWMIALFVIGGLIILAFILALMWLGARGRFIFTDCIVHNRGAIAEPWREFQKEGNSYFLFSLVAAFVFVIFAALLSLPLIILAIRGRYYLYLHRDRLDVYVLLVIAAWVFVILLVIIAWALIASFMLPVMYRRRCRAYEAFRAAASLIGAHPGEIVLYCLFLVVLAIATGLISCFAICATCCIAALPYIGTVILLPIYIAWRSFSLCFVRQFGPDYDVWANFTPPEFVPILSSAPPVPPSPTSSLNPPPEPPSLPAA
jgi:hypothetical protein